MVHDIQTSLALLQGAATWRVYRRDREDVARMFSKFHDDSYNPFPVISHKPAIRGREGGVVKTMYNTVARFTKGLQHLRR